MATVKGPTAQEADVWTLVLHYLALTQRGKPAGFATFRQLWRDLGFSHCLEVWTRLVWGDVMPPPCEGIGPIACMPGCILKCAWSRGLHAGGVAACA